MRGELLGAGVRRGALREVAEAVTQKVDDNAVLALDTQLAIRSGSVFL